jgi:hypothetical protein
VLAVLAVWPSGEQVMDNHGNVDQKKIASWRSPSPAAPIAFVLEKCRYSKKNGAN